VRDGARAQIVALLPRLRRFALSLTRDRDQGDDLVQETCVRALANIEQWQEGTRLDSWMYRIAQNIWFDRMRSKKSRGETIDIDDVHDLAGSDGRTVMDTRFTMQEVAKGIARLQPEQQVLVALVYIDGLSYKDAAEITGSPIGTVMSRLSRARSALHEAIHGEPQSNFTRAAVTPPGKTANDKLE
jgi:RNA polymerase sigma-70 factor, ECF subfamily